MNPRGKDIQIKLMKLYSKWRHGASKQTNALPLVYLPRGPHWWTDIYTLSLLPMPCLSHTQVAASSIAHTAPGPHGSCVLCHDFRSHAVRLWDECPLSSHSAIPHFNILCPKFQSKAITWWILSKTLNTIPGMHTFFLFIFHRKAQNLE